MKIAVFHNLPFGGAKRVLFEEVKALSKRNDVYLYQISGQGKDPFDLEGFAKETYWFDFSENNHFPSFLNRLYSDYKKIVVLRKIHKQIADKIDFSNFDAVLVHPDYYTQSPFILRYLKTKKVYYCHEFLRIAYEKELKIEDDIIFFKKWYENLIRKIYKNIDKSNARNSDVILVNSLYTKKNVAKAYKRDSIVCYPGVNSDFFKPMGSKTKRNLLFVGGKEKTLGLDLLRDVIKLIPQNKYILDIVAKEKDNKYISDEQTRMKYNNAIATVCLTVNEPFGMVPLESMSCGTPVIALDSGGYKETVIDNKTGFLIENTVSDLKRVLDSFNTSQLHEMGRAGREYVKSKFSWDKHMKILGKSLAQY